MFVPVGDGLLHILSFGSGPQTLLAFGGWAGSWELWAATFGPLSQTWRTVAYDHRGSGATLTPLTSITAENMTADVFAVMDALNIDRCVLAAESAGATIALLTALARPERFTGLVLVDGVIYHPASSATSLSVRALQTDFEAAIGDFADRCVPDPDEVAIRNWGRHILRRSGSAAAARLIECLSGIDLRPRVAEIALPTLIIHSEGDAIVSAHESRWLAGQMPNATLHVLPGGSHVPTMTRPDEVAAIINRAFGR
jgi:pimeloyl-ACP methyl ester carboxylesterase